MDYKIMFDKLAGEIVNNIGFLDIGNCTKKALTLVYRHILDRQMIYKAAWCSLYEESKKIKESYGDCSMGEAANIVIDAMERIAGGKENG